MGAAVYVYIKMHQESDSTPVNKNLGQETTQTKQNAGPATDKTINNGSSTAPVPNPSHPVSSLAKPIGPNNNTGTVSLSGATGMESVCRSVSGASCYIQASKDGKTIKVSVAKTVGSDTASDGVILDWDANQLTVGTWIIQAVASKDGQTASSDPQTLRVNS